MPLPPGVKCPVILLCCNITTVFQPTSHFLYFKNYHLTTKSKQSKMMTAKSNLTILWLNPPGTLEPNPPQPYLKWVAERCRRIYKKKTDCLRGWCQITHCLSYHSSIKKYTKKLHKSFRQQSPWSYAGLSCQWWNSQIPWQWWVIPFIAGRAAKRIIKATGTENMRPLQIPGDKNTMCFITLIFII